MHWVIHPFHVYSHPRFTPSSGRGGPGGGWSPDGGWSPTSDAGGAWDGGCCGALDPGAVGAGAGAAAGAPWWQGAANLLGGFVAGSIQFGIGLWDVGGAMLSMEGQVWGNLWSDVTSFFAPPPTPPVTPIVPPVVQWLENLF